MAKRTFANINWTPAATADTTSIASGAHMTILGGSATQLIDVLEVYIAGMAGSSTPTPTQLARNSTIGVTPTALAAPASDGPQNPATAALAAPPVSYTAAATGPQRSALTTNPKLQLGLNAQGGIIRWNAAPGQQYSILGNTAVLFGESSLSSANAGTPGAVNAHIIYEPY